MSVWGGVRVCVWVMCGLCVGWCVGGVRVVCGWCAGGVWVVCGWCVGGVRVVGGWCAGGVWVVCGWCAGGVWVVCGWCVGGVWVVCGLCVGGVRSFTRSLSSAPTDYRKCTASEFRCHSGQCVDRDVVCYDGKAARGRGCYDNSHLINCSKFITQCLLSSHQLK